MGKNTEVSKEREAFYRRMAEEEVTNYIGTELPQIVCTLCDKIATEVRDNTEVTPDARYLSMAVHRLLTSAFGPAPY